MQKILMVCLGNICRSPLAEGILKSKVNAKNTFIDSAGTAGYHMGHFPDKRSVEVAKKYGIDISYQRARQLTVDDFDTFDVIYAMDTNNFQDILSLTRHENDKNKVRMILNESNPHKNLSVPDPYYGGHQEFEKVYKILDEACKFIADKL